jgi:hypothetical protein
MTPLNDAKLLAWAKAPSESELERCGNTERMICDALNASIPLRDRTITVFAQGSYRNRTNVRQDSDVDICVLCTDFCYSDYTFAPGTTDADVGLSDASYSYAQFKNEVGQALVAHFGAAHVTRGKKAFDIHASSYRVDADVVPCFEYRQYQLDSQKRPYPVIGTAFIPDSGTRIHNWPEQHYRNGVAKNESTGRAFKGAARVLKNLRNEMADLGTAAAIPIPSYLLECMAYNTPNDVLTRDTWLATIKETLGTAYSALQSDPSCQGWVEVNDLKYLMRGGQPWTRQQALDFVVAAWQHAGF